MILNINLIFVITLAKVFKKKKNYVPNYNKHIVYVLKIRHDLNYISFSELLVRITI